MTRLTTLLLPLALVVLLAGCGGDDAPEGAGTIPGAAGVTIEDEVGGAPGPFQTTEFEPPLSINVPAGWRAREEFGMVQAFRGAGEAQAITFESLGEGDLNERVEQMRATAELEAEEPQEVTIGGHDGLMFNAQPAFAISVEGSEYYALGQGPLRVYVVDVDGTLVAIFAESSVLRTERREADEVTAAFFSEADQVVNSIEFGAAPDGGGTGDDTGDDAGTDEDTDTTP
jgi:hypothetical protein